MTTSTKLPSALIIDTPTEEATTPTAEVLPPAPSAHDALKELLSREDCAFVVLFGSEDNSVINVGLRFGASAKPYLHMLAHTLAHITLYEQDYVMGVAAELSKSPNRDCAGNA